MGLMDSSTFSASPGARLQAHRFVKNVVSYVEFTRRQPMFARAYALLKPISDRPFKQGLATLDARECLRKSVPVASYASSRGVDDLNLGLETLLPLFGFEYASSGSPKRIKITKDIWANADEATAPTPSTEA